MPNCALTVPSDRRSTSTLASSASSSKLSFDRPPSSQSSNPATSQEEEEAEGAGSRRARKSVNYALPNLRELVQLFQLVTEELVLTPLLLVAKCDSPRVMYQLSRKHLLVQGHINTLQVAGQVRLPKGTLQMKCMIARLWVTPATASRYHAEKAALSLAARKRTHRRHQQAVFAGGRIDSLHPRKLFFPTRQPHKNHTVS